MTKERRLDNCIDCQEGSYRKCDECLRNSIGILEHRIDSLISNNNTPKPCPECGTEVEKDENGKEVCTSCSTIINYNAS